MRDIVLTLLHLYDMTWAPPIQWHIIDNSSHDRACWPMSQHQTNHVQGEHFRSAHALGSRKHKDLMQVRLLLYTVLLPSVTSTPALCTQYPYPVYRLAHSLVGVPSTALERTQGKVDQSDCHPCVCMSGLISVAPWLEATAVDNKQREETSWVGHTSMTSCARPGNVIGSTPKYLADAWIWCGMMRVSLPASMTAMGRGRRLQASVHASA